MAVIKVWPSAPFKFNCISRIIILCSNEYVIKFGEVKCYGAGFIIFGIRVLTDHHFAGLFDEF